MKIVDVQQGSPEWIQARLGLPTASQFHRIVTAKTMKVSEQAHGYLCELLAERMMGCQVSDLSTPFMERGSALEQQAVALYELDRNVDTIPSGFCLRDDGRVGCSPDRLVGADGGLELKCPSAKVHVEYLLDGAEGVAAKYKPQIQGALWITGRLWWDSLSYHPMMPQALVRAERDPDYIMALAEAVAHFLERLEQAETRLRANGQWIENGAAATGLRPAGVTGTGAAPELFVQSAEAYNA